MKLVITTGFSGGHTFPALAFGSYLIRKHPGIKITYIGSEKAKEKYSYFDGLKAEEVVFFEDAPFSYRYFLKCIIINIKTFIKAYKILQYNRPDAVIGFGSYLSFPLVIVAWALRIKTVIHEQNATFGKANKILSYLATIVAVSFEGTSKKKKNIVTGNLLRESIIDIASRQVMLRNYSEKSIFRILVLGGSQGASSINSVLLETLTTLNVDEKEQLQIILISGEGDYEAMKTELEKVKVNYVLFAFTEDIALLYEKADIVIARSGSGVVFETLAFGLPSIFIPYPHASSHQKENAYTVKREGAAIVIEQKHLNAQRLKTEIFRLIKNKEYLQEMTERASRIRKLNGCELLENALFEMLNKRKK
ncbi:undecaprenyldiphospho-muramoylpentapeptide beta-N-acetylglucosaminyltransferase [Candidatus Omnitrophota bacterium]